MYLIELIIKKFFKKKDENPPVMFESKEQEKIENCEKHLYMPIDSTCDYLACKNCGHILRNIKEKKHRKNSAFDEF